MPCQGGGAGNWKSVKKSLTCLWGDRGRCGSEWSRMNAGGGSGPPRQEVLGVFGV